MLGMLRKNEVALLKVKAIQRCFALLIAVVMLVGVVPDTIIFANVTTGGSVDISFSSYNLGEMVQAKITVTPDIKGWIAYWMYDGKIAEEATRKTAEELNGLWEMGTVNFPRYTGIYVMFFDNTQLIGSPVGYDEDKFSISSPIKEWNQHTYAVYDIDLNWHEAKTFCEHLGGHLATITSQGEQTFIQSLLKSASRGNYWLGGEFHGSAYFLDHEVEDMSRWTWITGEKWGFWNWNSGEPNGTNVHGMPVYLEIYGPKNTGFTEYKWNDNVDYASGFICEWDMTNISLPSAIPTTTENWSNILFDKRGATVALNEVPITEVGWLDKHQANFTIPGLPIHITDYDYTVRTDGTTDIRFNVWNSSSKYGIVVVCNGDGTEVFKERNVVDKWNPNIQSLESWAKKGIEIADGFSYLINAETYKLNTKKTPINVSVPKNGYMFITFDPECQDYSLNLLEMIDLDGMILSATGKLGGVSWPANTEVLAKSIATNTGTEMLKLSESLFKDELIENLSFLSNGGDFESFLNFSSSILQGDRVSEFLKSSSTSVVFSVAENLFIGASAGVGQLLNGVFLVGNALNIQAKVYDYAKSIGSGYVRVDNRENSASKYIWASYHCPVEIEITYRGETLSSRSDNFNTMTSWGSLSFSGANFEQKDVLIHENIVLPSKLYGSGYGTMDYSVRYFDANGNMVNQYMAHTVSITPKTIITTTLDAAVVPVLNVDTAGNGTEVKKIRVENVVKSTPPPTTAPTPSPVPKPIPMTTPTPTPTPQTRSGFNLPPKDGHSYTYEIDTKTWRQEFSSNFYEIDAMWYNNSWIISLRRGNAIGDLHKSNVLDEQFEAELNELLLQRKQELSDEPTSIAIPPKGAQEEFQMYMYNMGNNSWQKATDSHKLPPNVLFASWNGSSWYLGVMDSQGGTPWGGIEEGVHNGAQKICYAYNGDELKRQVQYYLDNYDIAIPTSTSPTSNPT